MYSPLGMINLLFDLSIIALFVLALVDAIKGKRKLFLMIGSIVGLSSVGVGMLTSLESMRFYIENELLFMLIFLLAGIAASALLYVSMLKFALIKPENSDSGAQSNNSYGNTNNSYYGNANGYYYGNANNYYNQQRPYNNQPPLVMVGTVVIHSKFGEGTVVRFTNNGIVVLFSSGELEMAYPDVFYHGILTVKQ